MPFCRQADISGQIEVVSAQPADVTPITLNEACVTSVSTASHARAVAPPL